MRSTVLAIVLAAAPAAAAPKLASHYAPMFEKGRTWTYTLARTDFDFVGTKAVPMKPVLSTFTCSVTAVVKFPTAVVSTIHCDTEIDSDYGFRPDGMWVATKDGVFRAGSDGDTMPESAADIAMAAPTIRANPQETRIKRKDGYGGVFVQSVTNPVSDTWCAIDDTSQTGAGDGAITKRCFKAGIGLVRGKLDYYGGFPRIVEYSAQ